MMSGSKSNRGVSDWQRALGWPLAKSDLQAVLIVIVPFVGYSLGALIAYVLS
jgi:hypothetical protein